MPIPGRRCIYDFAWKNRNEIITGIDVKTKDLDSKKYSDGGICAIGNLLKFLANDRGQFWILEFGHTASAGTDSARDLEYIRVAPFIFLPKDSYRIENLGTGQVRLNYSLNQIWDEIDWERPLEDFYDCFVDLCIKHYIRVGRDADKRRKKLENFKQSKYTVYEGL